MPDGIADELEVQLHESEHQQVSELLAQISEKYSSRTATPANLTSLVHEMQDRMEELGLIVTVFLGKRLLREVFDVEMDDPDGTLEEDMTFQVVARTEEKPFDIERMAREVERDVAGKWWEDYRKRHANDPAPAVAPVDRPAGIQRGSGHGHEG